MSKAYIIEIHDRTAGIVTGDERGFTFFSSERAFDRLDGRDFRSAREAERAARESHSISRNTDSRPTGFGGSPVMNGRQMNATDTCTTA